MKKLSKLIFVFLFILCNIDIVFANTNLTIMPINSSDWGDTTLLESNGEYLLVDVAYSKTRDVLDYLDSNNVTKLDLYLSHYHGDHYGSKNQLKIEGISEEMNLMEYLIRSDKYDIGTLYLPDYTICEKAEIKQCNDLVVNFSKVANLMGVQIKILTTGSRFTFGSTNAEVLYVNKDESILENNADALINNSSLVTMFTNGQIKFLTAGDIEQIIENKILEEGINVSADIFKLNHHGIQINNEISNTQKFVNAVRPKYSYFQFVIENAWNYSYSAISKSIDNLSNFSNIYIPSVNGNIKFVIENDKITPIIEKNIHKITINYRDKTNSELLDTKCYEFSYNFYNNDINYYLYDYEKQFNNYTLTDGLEKIKTTGVLNADVTYDLFYDKNKVDLGNNENNSVQDEFLEPDTNPQTGDIDISLVFFLGILSLVYVSYYFKLFKIDQ